MADEPENGKEIFMHIKSVKSDKLKVKKELINPIVILKKEDETGMIMYSQNQSLKYIYYISL